MWKRSFFVWLRGHFLRHTGFKPSVFPLHPQLFQVKAMASRNSSARIFVLPLVRNLSCVFELSFTLPILTQTRREANPFGLSSCLVFYSCFATGSFLKRRSSNSRFRFITRSLRFADDPLCHLSVLKAPQWAICFLGKAADFRQRRNAKRECARPRCYFYPAFSV